MTATARRRARAGFSAIEATVIMLIFGLGVVALYSMFWTTSEEAFRSKWAYVAAHAAREELEAVRTLNLFGRNDSTPYAGHDWRPLGGSMLEDLEDGSTGGREEFQYPESYQRVQTRCVIEDGPTDRHKRITVFVRYEAKGSAEYGLATKTGEAIPIGTFSTLVVNPETR